MIPTHFVCGMEDPDVKEAMNLCFGSIINNNNNDTNENSLSLRGNMTGILVRCLASMVHHSNALMQFLTVHNGHIMGQIPIFNKPELLERLKGKVCNTASDRIRIPTGIPHMLKL